MIQAQQLTSLCSPSQQRLQKELKNNNPYKKPYEHRVKSNKNPKLLCWSGSGTDESYSPIQIIEPKCRMTTSKIILCSCNVIGQSIPYFSIQFFLLIIELINNRQHQQKVML